VRALPELSRETENQRTPRVASMLRTMEGKNIMEKIYVLIDAADEECLGYTKTNDLKAAVTAYLKRTSEWDNDGYYGNGYITLTGKEFVERPDLLSEEFDLVEVSPL
jgi:hypothetical protein